MHIAVNIPFTYVLAVLSPKICSFYISYGDNMKYLNICDILGTYIYLWEFAICMTLELSGCSLGMVDRELTRKVALCLVILDSFKSFKGNLSISFCLVHTCMWCKIQKV